MSATQLTPTEEIFRSALGLMGIRPEALSRFAQKIAEMRELDLPEPHQWLLRNLPGRTENDTLLHEFGLSLRSWDRFPSQDWAEDTKPTTRERRSLVYCRMEVETALRDLFDRMIPMFTESELPLVVAESHERWYGPEHRIRRYYWDGYKSYLRQQKGWSSNAIASLDGATDSVMEQVSDPTRKEAYPAKGLVIGYVQSGKTANFTAVVAKAADAGYRLVIVLAGTLDILRSQTQRRLDKELLGRELVGDDYAGDPDWPDFNSHGGRPSDQGYFDWDRLTGPVEDYQALKKGIAALDFTSRVKEKPFFAKENLDGSAVRLVVIKKNPTVIGRFARDLSRVRARIEQVPAMIIDDESDQASINTVNPARDGDKRTSTNREITNLLRVLPRSQYIGYTATPFATVLINPDEAESLFPRDFIISLPRPEGYMGVSDFYDPSDTPNGFLSRQQAFVRDIRGEDDDPGNLVKAIDSFILAGAIKLHRMSVSPERFQYRHHTMLVHHAVRREVHAGQAERVREAFESGGYHGGRGIDRLRELFEGDFAPVSAVQAPGIPTPSRFRDLEGSIGECIRRLNVDKTVRIVNGDNEDDTPSFEQGPIWSILVGGAKLSRGYTVEGLTTTYFRRASKTSDTLMQMGRWFGFRPGYRDLVRLFIGREEVLGHNRPPLDLYEAFRAICLDEEEFRSEIEKYLAEDLRPIQVPPLVPSHLATLMPTARNKMYNARITFKNLGAAYVERTVAPLSKHGAEENASVAASLLARAELQLMSLGVGEQGANLRDVDTYVGQVGNEDALAFLKVYKWEQDKDVMRHEIEYLQGREGDPEISGWLILVPQLKGAPKTWPGRLVEGVPQLSVKKRSRVGSRFKVYSEPDHVKLAKLFAGLQPETIVFSDAAVRFVRGRKKQAVMLLYPVKAPGETFVTIGFALQFPVNHLPKRVAYSVIRKAEPGTPDPVVIDLPDPAG